MVKACRTILVDSERDIRRGSKVGAKPDLAGGRAGRVRGAGLDNQAAAGFDGAALNFQRGRRRGGADADFAAHRLEHQGGVATVLLDGLDDSVVSAGLVAQFELLVGVRIALDDHLLGVGITARIVRLDDELTAWVAGANPDVARRIPYEREIGAAAN